MRKLFFILAVFSALVFAAVSGCTIFKACSLPDAVFVYAGTGAIHLGLFSIAMFFLWKGDLKGTLRGIGIPGDAKTHLIYSAIGLSAILLALFMLGLVSLAAGFNDEQKVSEKVMDLPLLILAFAVLIAPITEELFFRAFLSPRIGILFSAILFGLAHFTYGSVVEIVGVLFVGLLLGALYRMSRSLVPCVLVHMTYNFLSIALMLLLGGKA